MKEHPLAASLARYPWYLFFRDCYFWGPAFFLYFSSVLTLPQVLWLEAVYYVGVALLEVPSGYLSDTLGRKKVLVISSVSLSLAYLLFFTGSSFIQYAAAQLLLAAGFAFASGTDTALHYEILVGLGRQAEHVKREGRALSFSFLAGALAALVGGWLAVHHLRWVYGASFLSALISSGIALTLAEPQSGLVPPRRFADQVILLVKKAWHRRFRFFSLYAVFMTILVHFSYEFYQPFLKRVVLSMGMGPEITPGLAGIHLAATMLLGSLLTKIPGRITHYCRIRPVLIACLLFQAVLTGIMALLIHPAVAVLLMCRTLPKAISLPLINAELAPLLEQQERSTFLSLLSLAGRACYGGVLLLLPMGGGLFLDPFYGTLVSAAAVGGLLFGIICITPFPVDPDRACCSNRGG